METTGIDLPAEAEGIFANEDSFNSNVVSLAATPSDRPSTSRPWS